MLQSLSDEAKEQNARTHVNIDAQLNARYFDALPAREFAALSAWLSTFYPFQLDWILEPSRFAVCNKSRQIGMSHSTAALAVLWGAFHGELTTIISIGEREAKEVLSYAKKHRAVLVDLGSEMAKKLGEDSALGIDFASGGRIKALPSTAGRSFSGNVFLDEFAYQERAREVWDAAIAVTMHGGYRARVASTPNGIGNDFYNLWTDPVENKGWAKHEIDIHRAIREGMRVDIDACWKMAKGDPRIFGQLFECKFLDGALQYIPTEHVDACTFDGKIPPTTGYSFAGLDIGKEVDRSELYVIRKGVDGFWHIVHKDSCKRTKQTDLDRMVDTAFARFDIRRLSVDSTGLGAFPAEAMQKKHGRARVDPVTFTLLSKELMATILYMVIVGHQIKLPKSDVQLKDDLCSLQRIITDAGNVRYDAPRTDKGHADKAWALALALKAAGLQPSSGAASSGMV